jgi:hypothetical protein
LETFDAYSSQVLKDLQQEASKLDDEAFSKKVDLSFEVVLSNGETQNLKPGEDKARVSKENLDEYISKVQETRFNESKVQLEAMLEGMKLVFTDMSLLQLMDWE